MIKVLETDNVKNMQIVLKMAKQFGVNIRSERKSKLSKNYVNPSPSNDAWWGIPENYWEITRRVEDVKNGKAEYVSINDCELQEVFARCKK